MENTLENKAKFAVPYIGCTVVVLDEPKESFYPFDKNEAALKLTGILNGRLIIRRIAEDVKDRFNQCALELTPLSQITDEEAIEICEKCYKGLQENMIEAGKKLALSLSLINNNVVLPVDVCIWLTDYLRSKGYALPWMGLSVEQLVSFGWVKLTS